ncbi:hypothetical protein DFS34DRAFT_233843 [Phlyctochytrium arcticum]|nr:hypothetical protein DFS34DRAFT_233843 [Phlyctochytrium arcticum]
MSIETTLWPCMKSSCACIILEKRTFDTYDFFEVVKDIGGISKIKSWSEVARRLGFDPRGTNIAARVKDWMVYHHIGAFFDYLLGLPNEFYLQADGTPQKYPQSAPSGEGGSVKRSGSEDTGGGDQDEQPRPRKKYRKSSGGDANMTHAAQLQHSMRQQFQQQPPQQLQHPSPGGQDGNSQTWRFVDSIQSKMSGYRPPSEKGARHSRHYKRTGSDRHPSSRPSSGGGSSASRSRSRSPGGGLETESDEEKSRRRSAGSVGTLPGYGTTPSSARSLSRRNEGYPPYTDPQYRGLHHTPQQQHHHGRRDYGYPEYHPSPSGFAHPYASTPPSSGYPYQPHLHYPSMPPHHSSAPPPPPSGYATPDAPESDRYSNAGGTPRMRPIGTPPPAVGDASSEMTNSEKPHGTDPTHPTSPTPLTAPTTNTNSPNQTPTAPPPSSAQPPTPDQLHHRLSKLSHRNAWLEDRNHYLTSRCTELGELLRALNETVSLMRKDVNENRSQMDKVARIKDMMRGLVEELPPNTPRLQPPPPLPNASSSSTPGPAGR